MSTGITGIAEREQAGALSSHPAARMPKQAFHAVIIDDEPEIVRLLEDVVQTPALKTFGAFSAETGLELIRQHRPPLVLLDLIMPGVKGFDLLQEILAIDPGIDVILITGHYCPESAVEAIRHGAYDYITKPFAIDRLQQRIATWVTDAQLRHKTFELDSDLVRAFQLEGMIGRSPAMLEVFAKIRRIGPHFQTVLVTGETGTGKELAARALHRLSPISSGPFVVCNSAAIPENLFESELFGHVKGAFTGASQDRIGYARAAHGGTLFLDEIGDIPLHLQTKLLRLLQNREIQRVGSAHPEHVDVRVIAATNRDLRQLVAENKLREDLYYRLAMLEVKLPKLAERKEDLPMLQRYFLDLYAAQCGKPRINLTRRAQAAISRYTWPGNIRELENVLAASCMMSEGDTIDFTDLPEYLSGNSPTAVQDSNRLLTLEEMELQHARHVLERVSGNRAQAAEILGISRATLYRLIARMPEQA